MQAIANFFSFLFWTIVIVGAVFAFLAFKGYNGLRLLSENVKEAWSNIGVTVGKQASLINQLINTVSSYSEGEKLVMLKVSQDASLGAVQQVHQQGGLVLSAVNGLAQRFPDLKANGQYVTLMKSITDVENQLEHQRQSYNAATKAYNVRRTSIPDVFYSKLLGFGEAPYLDFDGSSEKNAVTMQQFVTDDGERLNQLLSSAGNKVKEVSQQATSAAITQGKQIAEVAKAKMVEIRHSTPSDQTITTTAPLTDNDAPIVATKPLQVRLQDLGGTANNQTFDIAPQGLVIGRSETADICVSDGQVSKHHAWVGQAHGRWLLKDKGSSNGTYVGSDLDARIDEIELAQDLIFTLGTNGTTKFKVTFV